MGLLNETEDQLIEQLDDKRLADLFLPAIKAVLKAGGGADQILRKSEALAACRLATSALSSKEETALKASIEILNRVQGKPVERRLNIYADVAEMTEEQLNRELRTLAIRAGIQEVAALVIEPKPKVLPPRSKMKRVSQNVDFDPNDSKKL